MMIEHDNYIFIDILYVLFDFNKLPTIQTSHVLNIAKRLKLKCFIVVILLPIHVHLWMIVCIYITDGNLYLLVMMITRMTVIINVVGKKWEKDDWSIYVAFLLRILLHWNINVWNWIEEIKVSSSCTLSVIFEGRILKCFILDTPILNLRKIKWTNMCYLINEVILRILWQKNLKTVKGKLFV